VNGAGEPTITDAAGALGPGPLIEDRVVRHLWPLFSRVLAAPDHAREIYLANHSLGRPLDRTARDVAEALDHWYASLDGAWGPWTELITRYRRLVALLIGCPRPDAVVHKVSAGQGLRTVLNAIEPKGPRPRVLTTRGEFDACDFILKAYASKGRIDLEFAESDERGRFDAERIAARITPAHDLVVVSHVIFSTGQVIEGVDRIAAAARTSRCLSLLDAYHGVGVVPVSMASLGVDFMIGGNYKYTRGGPGACWLAIAPEWLDHDALRPIDTGWFAKAGHFEFARGDEARYAPGGDGWLEGTPAVLCMAQALAGLEFTLAVGVERLRAYSLGQLAFLAGELRDRGVRVIDDQPRGAFLLLPVDEPGAAAGALRRAGVVSDGRPDPRGRGHLRLCPDVLTTRDELSRAAAAIAAVLPG
jgi:kynureninase